MSVIEYPVLFECAGESLLGVVAQPEHVDDGATGVLVVVGGPQYRVGSHRQFYLLSHHFAATGVSCMRFDYRGMGDSTGELRNFEDVEEDIHAAIDAFMRAVPAIKKVVLWGLCDGASAAALYAPTDSRVAGLVLLNPWVRTEAGEARTFLRHYYLRRLIDPAFWRKLLGCKVGIGASLGGVVAATRKATQGASDVAVMEKDLPGRMLGALERAKLPTLILLSGRDYVAREFEQCAAANAGWHKLVGENSWVLLEGADHTFSSIDFKDAVAHRTCQWVLELAHRKRSTSDE